MADYVVSDTSLTAVADAIRGKGGPEEFLTFPDGFVDAVEAIEASGYTMDEIITHKFSGPITYTGSYIAGGTFSTSDITEIHLPNVNSILGSGNSFTFQYCKRLVLIEIPQLASISNANYLFSGCSSLQSVFFPSLQHVGSFTFYQCTALKTAVFPKCTNTGYNTFSGTPLEIIDLGTSGNTPSLNFGDRAFNGVTSLSTIIIRKDNAIATLPNMTYLGPPFQSDGAGGTIFIPKVLYEELGTGSSLDYRSATNWSVLDGYGTINWAQIEGSRYETEYADGTPIG